MIFLTLLFTFLYPDDPDTGLCGLLRIVRYCRVGNQRITLRNLTDHS